MQKKHVFIGLAVIVLLAAGLFLLTRKGSAEPKYRKAKLDRGDVTATVTATGTLSAVTTVQVGSQVSGIIARLHVDFNSKVKKGQLLAELDPTPFEQQVEQNKANLQKASVQLRNDEIALARAKNLFVQQLNAQSDLDLAQTTRDSDAAAVAVSGATLKQAQTNLGYTKIKSPIDGVVVSRQYDVGQTVAASFQAPVIFTIAQDLTKMQVLTNIDEADVGRIRVDQVATFTVDAFADLTFKGTVAQIRLSPQTVQNVVTYPVMLDVPNADLKLMPGMTANVLVPVDTRKDTLRIPNAALRFRPDAASLVEEAKAGKSESGKNQNASSKGPETKGTETAGPEAKGSAGPAGKGVPGGGRPGGGSRQTGSSSGVVYVEVAGGKLKPVTVRTSITDGNFTAVESKDLKAGDEIILGLATARAGDLSGRPPAGGGAPGGGRKF
jgi:HlyD family secretion protein